LIHIKKGSRAGSWSSRHASVADPGPAARRRSRGRPAARLGRLDFCQNICARKRLCPA